ncbi:MAG: hypothetical protein JNK21_06840 [Rhodospirillaceae bacterium]|nr:hypothetical protein [Rhodospirillaceae bacterium]
MWRTDYQQRGDEYQGSDEDQPHWPNSRRFIIEAILSPDCAAFPVAWALPFKFVHELESNLIELILQSGWKASVFRFTPQVIKPEHHLLHVLGPIYGTSIFVCFLYQPSSSKLTAPFEAESGLQASAKS